MSIHVSFEGRIGQISEIKGEDKGRYVKVGIVTNKFVGEGKGDEYEGKVSAYKSTWLNATAFGSQAQYVADKFAKGDTIVVTDSELDVSTYTKKDSTGKVVDEKATSVGVILRDISGPYTRSAKIENSGQEQSTKVGKSVDFSNDIPF